MAKAYGVTLEIDREKKTWVFRSMPMFDPSTQKRYYDDIEAICKSDPRRYDVVEERDADNRFRSITITTN